MVKDFENYITFSAGTILGVLISYTGLLGFIAGIATGIFMADKYPEITSLVVTKNWTKLK